MTTRRGFMIAAGATVGLAGINRAEALSCEQPAFDKQVTRAKNVWAGEVIAVKKDSTNNTNKSYTIKILNRLKDGGLLKGKRQFELPAFTGWDQLKYKKGQVLLLFFGDRISVLCNFPIVLR